MAMSHTALKNAMKTAMLANITSPTSAQTAEIDTLCSSFATAIISCISSATLTYTTGLVSAAPGSPVTGSMSTVTIT